MGTLTSWNPLGHSRPVTGLLLHIKKGAYAGCIKIKLNSSKNAIFLEINFHVIV